MIRLPTTLVLGAGASIPYGFPSGRELLFEVIDELAPAANSDLKRDLISEGFGETQIGFFRDALLESHLQSIDAFLENRAVFLEIGKKAIAIKLIRKEVTSNLVRRKKMAWYEYVFDHIGDSKEDCADAPISFVTFNYDRSLEQFFFLTFQAAFGLREDEAKDLLSRLRIVHVYGQLAPLSVLDQRGRPYSNDVSREAIARAYEAIKIMAEGKDSSPQLVKARSFIQDSEILAFLGFGYHPANLDRLALDTVFHGHEVLGTAYGLGDDEMNRANERLSRCKIHFGENNQDNLDFLRNFPVLR